MKGPRERRGGAPADGGSSRCYVPLLNPFPRFEGLAAAALLKLGQRSIHTISARVSGKVKRIKSCFDENLQNIVNVRRPNQVFCCGTGTMRNLCRDSHSFRDVNYLKKTFKK